MRNHRLRSKYNSPGSPGSESTLLAMSQTSSPFIAVYEWDNATGYGTRLSNPGTLPGNAMYAADIHTDIVAVCGASSPYVHVYPIESGSFGTKYSNPASALPGNSYGVMFTHNKDAIIIIHSGGAGVSAYPWDDVTGFGTKYSDPSAVGGIPQFMDIHPDDDCVAIGTTSSPYIKVYPFNAATGLGTAYSNYSPLISVTGSPRFSPDGSVIFVMGGANSPHAWPWSSSTGFGTKYSNPASPVNQGAHVFGVSRSGTVVFCRGLSVNPAEYVAAYAWSNGSGWGSKFTTVPSPPHNLPYVTIINSDDSKLFLGMSSGPNYTYCYNWSNSTGFGSLISAPASPPTSAVFGAAFNA